MKNGDQSKRLLLFAVCDEDEKGMEVETKSICCFHFAISKGGGGGAIDGGCGRSLSSVVRDECEESRMLGPKVV